MCTCVQILRVAEAGLTRVDSDCNAVVFTNIVQICNVGTFVSVVARAHAAWALPPPHFNTRSQYVLTASRGFV